MTLKHKMKTMSGGGYDKQAHGGVGRGQNNLPGSSRNLRTKHLSPGKGEDYNKATPHAAGAVVADGIGRGRGYQVDAHSGLYHGRKGEAVGHKTDQAPMQWTSELYSEGRPLASENNNPGYVQGHDHPTKGSHATAHSMGHSTKAEHHPPTSGKAHEFNYMSSREAHGFGYSPSQHKGPLRMSGHAYGHQIGCKK